MLPAHRFSSLRTFSRPAPFLGAVLLVSAGAAGQTVPAITNPVPPVPQAPAPQETPAPPALSIVPELGGEAPAGADKMRVKVSAITVQGATIYSAEDLQAITADLIGKDVTIAQLFEAARAITAKYRDDGYILSRAFLPAQRVADGKFTIRVVEGFVSDVVIRGDVGDVTEQIRAYLANIIDSRPANIRDIERYLLLANDLPGISVRGTFRASTGEAGARQLVVDVAKTSFGGFVSYDNRGSRFLGPGEFTAGVNERSFTSFGERVDLIYFNTGNIADFNPGDIRGVDKQKFVELTFQGQIGGDGLRFRGFAGGGPSHPGYTLEPLNYRSDLFTGGGALFYPVIRSRRLNLGVTGQFDITNSTVSAGTPQVTTSLTYLRVLRGIVDFDLTDGWGGVNAIEFEGHKGLPILSASPSVNSPHAPRDGARSDFAKLTAKFSRLQSLWAGGGDRLQLYLETSGQYSFSVLYPVEEFRLGGTSFGRGYFNGRLVGDDGVGASAELRYDTPIALWSETGLPVEFYSYFDFGRVWSKVPTELQRASLTSAGVGFRAPVLDWLQVEAELSKPLTASTLDVVQGQAPKPPIEFFGSLTATF